MKIIFFTVIPFLLTYLGVELFRRWSLKKNILDLPNERSSHTQPTPRGGGLALVIVVFTFTFLGLYDFSLLPYFISALLVAVISWFDDIKHIPSGIRLLFHSLAASLIIIFIGYFDSIFGVQLGYIGIIFTFLWIVWMINAYNFMDGIDGIAGIQAITASLSWFLLSFFIGSQSGVIYSCVVFSSVLGFLIHNWSPARIFMGDVGSAFLGFYFAVFPIIMFKKNISDNSFFLDLFLISIVFVWFFVFDTIYTFFRRLLNGEKVWQAHRSHLYQRLVISGFSHQFVTLLYGIMSVLLLAFYYLLGIKSNLLTIIFLIGSGLGLIFFTTFNEKRNTKEN
ncbi:MAG: glycosyltransferase family 4 protein [Flavobacterium sp.]|jgi:UDP-N-acetylmuramyl pentapeptide phosphotransferase/UDP-N-acetylglucosamine-1-phosphate transferase|nr:glycosyltransferase family 4 protein [Flavobacterium sp.]